jgi:methylated-DNA-[protein]-cysteine S-methyltransferase
VVNHTVVDSPVGPITLVNHDGALCGVYLDGHRHGPEADRLGPRAPTGFEEAARQLDEYFAGRRQDFELATQAEGTPFQRLVWAALTRIPYGTTTTYGALAAQIGRPGASRAVGLANGRNPLSIVVPCHRVIGADGSLTGYGGGMERKAYLLAHEAGLLGTASVLSDRPGG